MGDLAYRNMEHWIAVLGATSLFRDAPDDARAELTDAAIIHECFKGEVLFAEGDRADRLCVILRGSARGVHCEPDGSFLVVDVLGQGQLAGALSLFGDMPMEGDVQADAGAVVAFLPRHVVERVVRTHPGMTLPILEQLALQWKRVVTFARTKTETVPARIARYMASLPRDTTGPNSYTVALPVNRITLAGMLAVAPESLSREMRVLSDLGVLNANYRAVHVLDADALERFVASGRRSEVPSQGVASAAARGVPRHWMIAFRAAQYWETASEKVVDQLAADAVLHECSKGELLYGAGRIVTRLAVILRGHARAVHYLASGQAVVVEMFKKGDVLGVVTTFGGSPLELDYEAGADTVIAWVSSEKFREFVRTESSVALATMRGMARHSVRVMQASKRNAVEVPSRLARYLGELPSIELGPQSFSVELPVSRTELAAVLATVPETLSRTFARLVDRGVIDAASRRVVVRDAPALEEIAESGMPN